MTTLFDAARRIALPALVASTALAALPAAAVTWTFTGPGTTSTSAAGDTDTFDYNLSGFSGTWTATATADRTGQYVFDWDYSGFHSWFAANARLDTFGGGGSTTLVNSTTFGGFSFSGTGMVFDVNVGDTFGFTITGSHGDSARVVSGTLSVTDMSAVPVPAAAFLLLSGLGALGASRRLRG